MQLRGLFLGASSTTSFHVWCGNHRGGGISPRRGRFLGIVQRTGTNGRTFADVTSESITHIGRILRSLPRCTTKIPPRELTLPIFRASWLLKSRSNLRNQTQGTFLSPLGRNSRNLRVRDDPASPSKTFTTSCWRDVPSLLNSQNSLSLANIPQPPSKSHFSHCSRLKSRAIRSRRCHLLEINTKKPLIRHRPSST